MLPVKSVVCYTSLSNLLLSQSILPQEDIPDFINQDSPLLNSGWKFGFPTNQHHFLGSNHYQEQKDQIQANQSYTQLKLNKDTQSPSASQQNTSYENDYNSEDIELIQQSHHQPEPKNFLVNMEQSQNNNKIIWKQKEASMNLQNSCNQQQNNLQQFKDPLLNNLVNSTNLSSKENSGFDNQFNDTKQGADLKKLDQQSGSPNSNILKRQKTNSSKSSHQANQNDLQNQNQEYNVNHKSSEPVIGPDKVQSDSTIQNESKSQRGVNKLNAKQQAKGVEMSLLISNLQQTQNQVLADLHHERKQRSARTYIHEDNRQSNQQSFSEDAYPLSNVKDNLMLSNIDHDAITQPQYCSMDSLSSVIELAPNEFTRGKQNNQYPNNSQVPSKKGSAIIDNIDKAQDQLQLQNMFIEFNNIEDFIAQDLIQHSMDNSQSLPQWKENLNQFYLLKFSQLEDYYAQPQIDLQQLGQRQKWQWNINLDNFYKTLYFELTGLQLDQPLNLEQYHQYILQIKNDDYEQCKFALWELYNAFVNQQPNQQRTNIKLSHQQNQSDLIEYPDGVTYAQDLDHLYGIVYWELYNIYEKKYKNIDSNDKLDQQLNYIEYQNLQPSLQTQFEECELKKNLDRHYVDQQWDLYYQSLNNDYKPAMQDRLNVIFHIRSNYTKFKTGQEKRYNDCNQDVNNYIDDLQKNCRNHSQNKQVNAANYNVQGSNLKNTGHNLDTKFHSFNNKQKTIKFSEKSTELSQDLNSQKFRDGIINQPLPQKQRSLDKNVGRGQIGRLQSQKSNFEYKIQQLQSKNTEVQQTLKGEQGSQILNDIDLQQLDQQSPIKGSPMISNQSYALFNTQVQQLVDQLVAQKLQQLGAISSQPNYKYLDTSTNKNDLSQKNEKMPEDISWAGKQKQNSFQAKSKQGYEQIAMADSKSCEQFKLSITEQLQVINQDLIQRGQQLLSISRDLEVQHLKQKILQQSQQLERQKEDYNLLENFTKQAVLSNNAFLQHYTAKGNNLWNDQKIASEKSSKEQKGLGKDEAKQEDQMQDGFDSQLIEDFATKQNYELLQAQILNTCKSGYLAGLKQQIPEQSQLHGRPSQQIQVQNQSQQSLLPVKLSICKDCFYENTQQKLSDTTPQ